MGEIRGIDPDYFVCGYNQRPTFWYPVSKASWCNQVVKSDGTIDLDFLPSPQLAQSLSTRYNILGEAR